MARCRFDIRWGTMTGVDAKELLSWVDELLRQPISEVVDDLKDMQGRLDRAVYGYDEEGN